MHEQNKSSEAPTYMSFINQGTLKHYLIIKIKDNKRITHTRNKTDEGPEAQKILRTK